MDTKKIIILLIAGIVVLGAASIIVFFMSGNNKEAGQSDITVAPARDVEFVVVRVLPSGFSPQEIEIKKGMIVRFTNPLDTKVSLKWEGATQFTKGAVYAEHDIATTVFDTEGTYIFTDDAASPHKGKVTVR